MSDQEAATVWQNMPESPFRKLIQYELEIRKASEADKCSMLPPAEVAKQQGIVEGIKIALGVLARKDPAGRLQR